MVKENNFLGRIFERDSFFVERRKEPRRKREAFIYCIIAEESEREKGSDWRQERRSR